MSVARAAAKSVGRGGATLTGHGTGHQATVPYITPAGAGMDSGRAGSGVNVLPRKIP